MRTNQGYLLLLILVPLLSCKQPAIPEYVADPVDSFIVDILERPADFRHVYAEGDSGLSGFCANDQVLVQYRRVGQRMICSAREYIEAPGLLLCSWKDEQGKWTFIDEHCCMWHYDKLRRLTSSGCLFDRPADNISLGASSAMPVVFYKGDTILSFIKYGKRIDESVRSGNALLRIGSKGVSPFFQRTGSLKQAIQVEQMYCLNGSKLVMLYAGIDTVYTMDLSSGVCQQIAIANPHYTPQKPADPDIITDVGKRASYYASNFTYCGIFFNPRTGNYALLYNEPEKSEDMLPSGDGKITGVIILDASFHKIANYRFRRPAWIGLAFTTAAGLVIPVDPQKHNGNAYHDLPCYVYHF
ncbi:MAG: hypothetical protein QM743_05495 [Chitinophagaceae bacterium]